MRAVRGAVTEYLAPGGLPISEGGHFLDEVLVTQIVLWVRIARGKLLKHLIRGDLKRLPTLWKPSHRLTLDDDSPTANNHLYFCASTVSFEPKKKWMMLLT